MPRPIRRHTLMLLMVLCAYCGGCGSERYEQRLEETRKLFVYEDELNENLGGSWAESSVSIRMPKGFALLPAPKVETDEEGNELESGPDPRQPTQAGIMTEELPGLLGAWTASVEADVANGGSPDFQGATAYAYVLGNHALWMQNEVEEAAQFHETVLTAVVNGLNLPEPDPAAWQPVRYPPKGGYAKSKQAQVLVMKTSGLVGQTQAEASLHLFEDGPEGQKVKLAILFIYPATINASERIQKRIELALETLSYSPNHPTAGDESGAGGASGGGF